MIPVDRINLISRERDSVNGMFHLCFTAAREALKPVWSSGRREYMPRGTLSAGCDKMLRQAQVEKRCSSPRIQRTGTVGNPEDRIDDRLRPMALT
jgi:hypothetical protein